MLQSELNDVLEPLNFDPLETDAVYRELESRSIDVILDVDEDGEPHRPAAAGAAAAADLLGDDDRRAAALPARGRPPSAADGRPGGRAREADRGRRRAREAADDPVQPAARRLDREELPQPGPAVPRPDPGRHARPDPRRREVRLAPRLQVLDLRHLVDPPGGRAGARRQGPDDPDARPHRRADAEDEPRRAAALGARSAASRRSRRSPTRRTCRCSRPRRSRRPRAPRARSTRRSATPTTRRSATSSPAKGRSPTSRSRTPCARRRSQTRCTRCRTATAPSSSSATASTTPSRRRSRRSAAGSA